MKLVKQRRSLATTETIGKDLGGLDHRGRKPEELQDITIHSTVEVAGRVTGRVRPSCGE
jgi:hypothetical protein